MTTSASIRERPAERRLMEAAVRAFSQRGFSAAGIRGIAADAGLTIGALYHYADGKEALFLRLVTEAYEHSIADLEAAVARGATPESQLINLVDTHVRAEVAERDLWSISRTELNALTPEGRAHVIALRDRFEAVWAQVIRQGCEVGAFSPADEVIVRISLLRMCTSVGDWFNPDGRLGVDEVVEVLTRQALALLA